jgi:hypothetical protein
LRTSLHHAAPRATQGIRNPRWPTVTDRRNEHRRGYEFLIVAEYSLQEPDRRSAQTCNLRFDREQIVHQSRRKIVDLQAAHRKHGAGASLEYPMLKPSAAKPLCSPPLKESQVGGVIDSSREIGVLVVDPDFKRFANLQHPSDSSLGL